MNEYLVECHECEDEMIVECNADVPAYCPLCGGDDVDVSRGEREIEWDEDE
tara:strand:+ start:3347 stop:3499 length:153 start_codon:yes stop_codon:yes gene_type:complete